MDTFKVFINAQDVEVMVPIPDVRQNIGWLKSEFKVRAEQRGKDLNVSELSCNGYLLDNADCIADVLSDQARLVALGPGSFEQYHRSISGGNHSFFANGGSVGGVGIGSISTSNSSSSMGASAHEDSRTKRKYTRGGHKKLKIVAHVLEAHLPEMMRTTEKERQKFYGGCDVGGVRC